ncbi:hypothetical protein ACJX0J_012566 [Zea mays]
MFHELYPIQTLDFGNLVFSLTRAVFGNLMDVYTTNELRFSFSWLVCLLTYLGFLVGVLNYYSRLMGLMIGMCDWINNAESSGHYILCLGIDLISSIAGLISSILGIFQISKFFFIFLNFEIHFYFFIRIYNNKYMYNNNKIFIK